MTQSVSAATQAAPDPWWGEYTLTPDQIAHWQIGPLELWIARVSYEWRIAKKAGVEGENDAIAVDLACGSMPEEYTRFAFHKIQGPLVLKPALLDRAFIVRPERPFHLAPKNQVCLYITSPLSLWIGVGRPAIELMQIPVSRPSDTWFGASPMDGEMCYAARMFARLDFDNLVMKPFRAITAVYIDNYGDRMLSVEQVRVPLPSMGLSIDAAGRFWTQSVRYENESHQGMARLRLESAPSLAQAPLKPIVEARLKDKSAVVRAFETLIARDLWRN